MTSLETLIAVQRLGKLGILEGLQLTDAFSSHVAHHFKSTSIDSMTVLAKEHSIEDSEGIIGASLILSFCHYQLPENYDLKTLVQALTDIRNNAIKQDDLKRLEDKYKQLHSIERADTNKLPTPDEFKAIDEVADKLKQS